VQSGQRHAQLRGQLTGQRLDRDHHFGGKDPRPAGAGTFSQARQALFEEVLAPLRHDLAAGVQPRGDLVVAEPRAVSSTILVRTISRNGNV
jgi:hypothetical protein